MKLAGAKADATEYLHAQETEHMRTSCMTLDDHLLQMLLPGAPCDSFGDQHVLDVPDNALARMPTALIGRGLASIDP